MKVKSKDSGLNDGAALAVKEQQSEKERPFQEIKQLARMHSLDQEEANKGVRPGGNFLSWLLSR